MQRRGAYGLALDGLHHLHPCLPAAPLSWPVWSCRWVPPGQAPDHPDYVRYGPAGHVALLLSASRQEVVAVHPEPPSAAAYLHPWLTTAAALQAHRVGDDGFHAGGLVKDGRVWALLGDKGAGKTSALAAASQRGLAITGDDLVVLRGDECLSGPAALDLREATAAALGCGDVEQLVRGETRWRLYAEPAPAVLPFAGFVLPEWGEGAVLKQVGVRERLAALSRNLFVQQANDRGQRLLELLDKPVLRWSRPHDIDDLVDSVDRLLDQLP